MVVLNTFINALCGNDILSFLYRYFFNVTQSSINSVLFICLGNICRSPSAHGVFRHMIKSERLDIKVDSAGTAAYHKGVGPDPRSQKAANKRGYEFSDLKSRKVQVHDFHDFDLILAMDESNLRDLQETCPEQHKHKLQLMMDFALEHSDQKEVPDPYYGGAAGFEYVLDLIEDASKGLLKKITS
jgi:protein-tyrosine phosphatase